MAINRMTKVCRRHERSFLKALKEADSLKEKEVHRLRVDVKNLRVLLQLHHLLSDKKKPENKMQKLIQPLFDSAGEMRTAALNLKQTATYHNPVINKFRQKMKAREKAAAKKLLQDIKDFKPKKFTSLNKKIVEGFQKKKNKELRNEAAEYLRVLFAKIRADLFDINDDETLHEIRKKLKIIKNLGVLMEEIDAEHPFAEELEKVNSTYDKIGQWHDTATLLKSLEDFLKELNDTKATQKTAPLLEMLRKRALRNKKQIERKLRVDLVM